jgi:GNAT superfamily N-acetyltransferase
VNAAAKRTSAAASERWWVRTHGIGRRNRLTIRLLEPADVEPLDVALRAAYGYDQPQAPRLRSYLDTPAVATFVAAEDGVPLGCVFGIDYGAAAYVSFMGVDPRAQGRGVGRALLDALITWSDECAIGTLHLDATPAGAPLYERAGFVDDGETVVFTRPATSGSMRQAPRAATDPPRRAMLARDRAVFGADRRPILEPLFDCCENHVFACDDGSYAVAQPDTIGPLVASDAVRAEALFDAALAARPGVALRVCAPTQQPDAAQLLIARGFTAARRLRHMVRGPRLAADETALWARINLGQG